MKEEYEKFLQGRTKSNFDQNKWLNMGVNFLQKENVPSFKLDELMRSTLKGSQTFDYFVSKLKQWNNKVKTTIRYSKKEFEVYQFIQIHLVSITRKPKSIQQELLNNLHKWYEQTVNPRPKIAQILRNFKRKRVIAQSEQDENIRKTFTSNLSLKQNQIKKELIIFTEDNLDKTFNEDEFNNLQKIIDKQDYVNERVSQRLKRRQQCTLQSWRQGQQMNSMIKQTAENRTKRLEKAYFAQSHFKKERNSLGRPRTQNYKLMCQSRSQIVKTPSITGLTLMVNPFQIKN